MSTADEIARLPVPERGRFGEFGGQYVAETLMPAITELEAAWRTARADVAYWAEVDHLLASYVGRPSLLYRARRLSADVGALFGMPCEVFMGAEDVVRQALNVERMKLLGATVHSVASGTRTLKDAMNE